LLGFRRVHHRIFTRSRWRLPGLVTKALFSHPKSGDYTHWKHATPRQLAGAENQIFAKGTWGGEWHPDFVPQEGDIIIKEHWAQSGFANTDLDQQLKQHGIEKIILIGMLANTCIESTGRFGMELGYHVTLVKDATAAFSREEMRAAELNGPTFAHAIVSTSEIVAALAEQMEFRGEQT
jgi:nicotinamidase-related amidase